MSIILTIFHRKTQQNHSIQTEKTQVVSYDKLIYRNIFLRGDPLIYSKNYSVHKTYFCLSLHFVTCMYSKEAIVNFMFVFIYLHIAFRNDKKKLKLSQRCGECTVECLICGVNKVLPFISSVKNDKLSFQYR